MTMGKCSCPQGDSTASFLFAMAINPVLE